MFVIFLAENNVFDRKQPVPEEAIRDRASSHDKPKLLRQIQMQVKAVTTREILHKRHTTTRTQQDKMNEREQVSALIYQGLDYRL